MKIPIERGLALGMSKGAFATLPRTAAENRNMGEYSDEEKTYEHPVAVDLTVGGERSRCPEALFPAKFHSLAILDLNEAGRDLQEYLRMILCERDHCRKGYFQRGVAVFECIQPAPAVSSPNLNHLLWSHHARRWLCRTCRQHKTRTPRQLNLAVRDGNCRAAPNHNRFGATFAKNSHIQQVVKGDGANFDNKLKGRWIKSDLCGSEFAGVVGDALRQGASSNDFQERALQCTILQCVFSRAMPILLNNDNDCLHAQFDEERSF